MSPEMQTDYARWSELQREREEKAKAKGRAVGTFEQLREQMIKAFETLPEKPAIPFHLTPEGDRWAKFKAVCDDEFRKPVQRALLPNPKAFDAIASWDGSFPGPCGVGPTDTAKSRAAWQALGRLYVRENKAFTWFPVRRLVTELEKYESMNAADEFFRMNNMFPILFVDDADKLNWQFESQKSALFAFYDWIYRKNKPCITTTNKDRTWWAERMGEPFARRLFDDAHKLVQF